MVSFSRLGALFRKKKLDAEMTEEMRLHLELLTEQNIARGMAPEEARYAAQRAFGGVDQVMEQCRDQRGWAWLGQVARDLRFSARSLRRSPGFTLTVVFTLALCIGANTTVFSALYGLILRRLPFREPGQLVEVYNSQIKAGQPKKLISVAQYLSLKANADLFEGFALWRDWTFNIGENSEAYRGVGARVSAEFFSLLGIHPLLGRFYTMQEGVPGKDHVLVLTQSYWEKTYKADPDVIGKVLRLSGEEFTIIGVAPKTLEEFNGVAIFLKPFEWTADAATPRSRLAQAATMYARVKSGVSLSSALSQLKTIETRFQDQLAPPDIREFINRTGQTVAMGQVRAEQSKSVKTGLLLLQGCALFVLVLGCINVANLMLARANARQVELAVRQALGAGRGALARQLFTEGLLLALAGALCGITLTWTSLHVINIYTADMVREVQPIDINEAVLGSTTAAGALVAAMITLLPIVNTWRTNLLASMQGGARGATGSSGMRVVSGLLVTLQVTLAMTLLVGACLLIRSFAKVMAINPGFDAWHLIHGRVAFNGLSTPAEDKAKQDLIMAKMREIPGVDSICYSSNRVVDGHFYTTSFPIRGSLLGSQDTYPTAKWLGVSPGFFRTMGIRLIEGRDFNEGDVQSKFPCAYIVDRRFAERYFPGRSPVGEKFKFGEGNKPEEEPVIVGVVEVAKLGGQDEQDGAPFVYAALGAGWGGFSIEVRTQRPFEDMVAQMRAKLRSVDPTLPLYGVAHLQADLDGLAANRRGIMTLLVGLALIALILAAVGIYGMLAYDVSRRTREIGIRGAIGATRGEIVSMILRQMLWKVSLGLALGLLLAFSLSRFMSSLLFDVKPTDPLTYFGVTALLATVALLSSWLPARRAAKVDPIVALRCE